jgi:ArsR family transcriptional regulator, arsenate/arsenite/antimonite-responsive transcriptional repressor
LSKYKTSSILNNIFKALNDPIRRDILDLLKDKDMSAGDIADHFNIGKPTISHHLDLLRQARLVTSEKQGQFIIYSINTTVLDEMLQWIYQIKSK